MVLALHCAPDELSTDELRAQFAYQPFKLPDGTVTGAGLAMIRPSRIRFANPDELAGEESVQFINGALAQHRMYEDFISGIKEKLRRIRGMSYLDIACNAGYFCYRMLQEGCSTAVGVDPGEYSQAFRAANHALNLEASFINAPYDMIQHKLPIEESYDIVSCIAFMCHCSDPTYLLTEICKHAKKAVVLFSCFPPSNKLFVEYGEASSRYFHQPFPICFDSRTAVSESLLRVGFKHFGFETSEIPRQQHWLPRDETFRCFIGTRE